MASKKYLDQGGVSHLWDKVKEYLTSKFGTGTYDNGGSIYNQGALSILSNTRIDASYLSIEVGESSRPYFRAGLNGAILFGGDDIEIKCNAGFGLYFDDDSFGPSDFSVWNRSTNNLLLWQILFRPNRTPTAQSLTNLSASESRDFTKYKDGTLWLFAWSVVS